MIRKVVSEGIMPLGLPPTHPQDIPRLGPMTVPFPHRTKPTSLHGSKTGNRKETRRTPLPRIRKSEWTIGTPDAIFSLPREIKVKATGQMPYVYLRVKTNFPEDRWIQATEVRPTAPEVVHHVLVFASGADGIKREQAGALAAYVHGNTFVEFPPGVAKKLPSRATLLFQMHYTPTGKATTDRTQIGLRFIKTPPDKTVRTLPVVNRRINIPPHAPDLRRNRFEIRSAWHRRAGLHAPHAPQGKAFKYELLTQGGKGKRCLRVPCSYDFNWQLRYELKNPRPLPGGSRIRVTRFSTTARTTQQTRTPTSVRWGDQSDEEMLIGYVECEFENSNSAVDQQDGRRDLFTQLDKNKDGFLTKNEFTRPGLFPLFDSDKDGRVTKKEGIEGLAKQEKAKQGPQRRLAGACLTCFHRNGRPVRANARRSATWPRAGSIHR